MTILAVGGMSETLRKDPRTAVSGMLAQVTDRLDERFDCRWVRYPASHGPVLPDATGSVIETAWLPVSRTYAPPWHGRPDR